MTLTRTEYRDDGIFGELRDDTGTVIAVTLEHSYDKVPKIPAGTYTCVKGQHQLHSMTHPFTAFMLENVPNHTNCLIHMGNWNDDSDGCILVGKDVAQSPKGQMITASIITFNALMTSLAGADSFVLQIA